MTKAGVTRRGLIKGAASVAILLAAAKGGQVFLSSSPAEDRNPRDSSEGLSEHEANTLRRMVECLFPYQGLDGGVYQLVVDGVSDAQGVEQVTQLLINGVQQLDKAAGGAIWLELPEDRQIASLKAIESTEFFQVILNASIHTLHSNEALWKLIGYQGSSVQFGGYIHRGFNDIDWLPEQVG